MVLSKISYDTKDYHRIPFGTLSYEPWKRFLYPYLTFKDHGIPFCTLFKIILMTFGYLLISLGTSEHL